MEICRVGRPSRSGYPDIGTAATGDFFAGQACVVQKRPSHRKGSPSLLPRQRRFRRSGREAMPLLPISVRPGGTRAVATRTILDNATTGGEHGRSRGFPRVSGHTVTAEAVDVLGERFTEVTSGNWVTLGGRAVPLGTTKWQGCRWMKTGFRRSTPRPGVGTATHELADRNSFVLPLGRTMPRRGREASAVGGVREHLGSPAGPTAT